MAVFLLKDYRPYRLVLAESGPHSFGGPPRHKGTTPSGTDTPLHLMLTIDLSDANCPVKTSSTIKQLPLYYPLKYGFGGPAVQYTVLSDTEIQILHMSDELPDAPSEQYVQVPHLPECKAQIIPLEYEEARAIALGVADAYFQRNTEDRAVLDRIDYWNNLFVAIGGLQIGVRNAQDVICHNKECEFFGRRVHFEVVASMPPIPVNGSTDFWYEYDGDVEFCFGLCYYCGTVIAFNRAS